MSKVLNILDATNAELIAGITTSLLNAFSAARIFNLPPLDPEAHFEHNEAKIAFGLFDGTPPDDAELDRLRTMPANRQPAYWRETEQTVMDIIRVFHLRTGRRLPEDELTLNDRAVLWQITLDRAHAVIHERRTGTTVRYPIP